MVIGGAPEWEYWRENFYLQPYPQHDHITRIIYEMHERLTQLELWARDQPKERQTEALATRIATLEAELATLKEAMETEAQIKRAINEMTAEEATSW